MEEGDDKEEYLVFKRTPEFEKWWRWLVATDDTYPDPLKSVAVVELRHAWAGPALHILAASCAMSAGLSFDSDQAAAIRQYGDYFNKQALRADDGPCEIPTGDE